MFVQNL